MLLIILYLLLPSYDTHNYPPEVYNVIYGDLGMEDLYLPETTDDNFTETELKKISSLDVRELLRDTPKEPFPSFENITDNGEDAREYNDISAPILNYTRKRVFSHFYGYEDYVDFYHEGNMEHNKMRMFEKISLMYLYHSRYKMASAFKQREAIRNDKRYKLGYLFNRLRRLKTEMIKVVSIAKTQHKYYWNQNLTSMMRMYERVVNLDVDIRDTIDLVGAVFSQNASFDYLG